MKKYLYSAIAVMFLFTNIYATDYYVLQGAKRGKGTKERPYKGIYKALKKAAKGDVIHVAAGVYHGKLKIGYLTLDKSGITLLGGYDKDFSQRNPWENPTFIGMPKKKKTSGADLGIIYATKDHSGLVIDGFIFDSATRNVYKDDSLVLGMSARRPAVLLSSPDCVVRNCVFMNSALGACRISGANSRIENCLFVNNVYYALELDATGKVAVINNSFIRTYKQRFTGGIGVSIGRRSKMQIHNNIFAFNDETAISNKQNNPHHSFVNNIFHKNKKSCYTFYSSESRNTIEVEDAEDLEDAELEEAEDNFLLDPQYNFAEKKGEKKLYAPPLDYARVKAYLSPQESEAKGIGVQLNK
ncbi:right-handed parallel beta-helix repeat-containing protein [Candidatus Uabimicrobium amorphum]|uniref:Right handed beta helix domain-containing protein n=1 Tax=Uabimicrobium amorphum TaxID=2596890 RepID=A0A5S9IL00_UABAM|nr:right-handed parallel beta-helix repeat-containing protein [Candidatus Uabimicrobium amorphum]BBM83447.1 hypothetical protein UABAM_01799 [Candidatus Uabimicrobium amorphum]